MFDKPPSLPMQLLRASDTVQRTRSRMNALATGASNDDHTR